MQHVLVVVEKSKLKMWNKFKNLKYNVKLNIFYGIAVIFITYFIWDINQITTAISNNQFITESSNDLFTYTTNISYDYTLTLGGAIRNIALDIIQIIFLVFFILKLNIHEVYNGSK